MPIDLKVSKHPFAKNYCFNAFLKQCNFKIKSEIFRWFRLQPCDIMHNLKFLKLDGVSMHTNKNAFL